MARIDVNGGDHVAAPTPHIFMAAVGRPDSTHPGQLFWKHELLVVPFSGEGRREVSQLLCYHMAREGCQGVASHVCAFPRPCAPQLFQQAPGYRDRKGLDSLCSRRPATRPCVWHA
jgi:hypothetical protein